MEELKCPSCQQGTIQPRSARGQAFQHRQVPNLEITEDVSIPTCTSCGEQWLDAASTQRLQEALENAYRALLTQKAESAIESLRERLPQRELERLVGVSAGYFSKLKGGKETAAPLVALLMLLGERPHRLDELKRLWAAHPEKVPGPRLAAPPKLQMTSHLQIHVEQKFVRTVPVPARTQAVPMEFFLEEEGAAA